MLIEDIPYDLIRDSNWGWDSTMTSKLLDMAEIEKYIDPDLWTSKELAIKATADSLLQEKHDLDESYYCMDGLEKMVAGAGDSGSGSRDEYLVAIKECAAKRKRLAIDRKLSD